MKPYQVEYEAIPSALWTARKRRSSEALLPGHTRAHVAMGRGALLWLTQALGWRRGDRVLLPAYTCYSVVEPFKAAGLVPVFYGLNEDLSVDLGDLVGRLEPGIRGGLVIHYFGWPQPPIVLEWLRSRKGASDVWIEDVTQSLFSTSALGESLGGFGGAAVASYRKLFPSPDGSLVTISAGTAGNPPPVPMRCRYEVHGVSRGVQMAAAGVAHDLGLKRFGTGAMFRALSRRLRPMRIAEPITIGRMSPISRWIVERFDVTRASERRRSNAEALLTELAEHAHLRPLFSDLPHGVVPMVLPVRIPKGRRDRFLAAMRARGLHVHHHWKRPSDVERGRFRVVDLLCDEQVSLPVDERFRPSDMAYVAEVAAEVLRAD